MIPAIAPLPRRPLSFAHPLRFVAQPENGPEKSGRVADNCFSLSHIRRDIKVTPGGIDSSVQGCSSRPRLAWCGAG